MQYAVKGSNGKVGYCSLSIKCGTRAEGDLPEGTAHFVEHTIFKGTKRLSAARINSYLDRLGGELNAYTTKEEIVLHATVLREDIWKAVGLLLEIATEATFPEHEVETERGVILDEIISYKDSPSEDIFDNFESRFFAGSPLGRLTLGTLESVGKATVEDLKTYYRRNFIPRNMALCIVASGDEADLEKQVLKHIKSVGGDGDCHGGSAFRDHSLREVPRTTIPQTPCLPPILNFNAIAQGYSCDLVFDMLRGLGVTDMLVDIGEIRCCGLNPLGNGWTVGIDNPVDGNDKPGEDIRQVWTSDGGDHGVVTSGNYRKFYVRDGKKYSHTIDPRTGRPVEHNLLSATVVAPTAAEADALATVFMVIGFDAARDFLETRPDLEAYLIPADSIWSSR